MRTRASLIVSRKDKTIRHYLIGAKDRLVQHCETGPAIIFDSMHYYYCLNGDLVDYEHWLHHVNYYKKTRQLFAQKSKVR